jgi:hypothetical protein
VEKMGEAPAGLLNPPVAGDINGPQQAPIKVGPPPGGRTQMTTRRGQKVGVDDDVDLVDLNEVKNNIIKFFNIFFKS